MSTGGAASEDAAENRERRAMLRYEALLLESAREEEGVLRELEIEADVKKQLDVLEREKITRDRAARRRGRGV